MFNKKRNLLVVAVLLIVSMLAGCTGVDEPVVETNPSTSTNDVINTDVLVVGGGAAGLAAALEAVEEGVSVTLIEKLSMLGGSTLLSGGIMYGAETPIQKRQGVDEKWEDLAEYWIEMAEGDVDVEMINFIAKNSGETFEWLEANGVKFQETLSTEGISPALRGHTTENRGFGMIQPLEEVARDKGVDILLSTTVTKLLIDEHGNVIGAEAEGKDANKITVNAKSVILATGGYDQSDDVIGSYSPIAKGQFSYAAAGNKGDGLLMAKEAGADIVAKNGVIGFRGVSKNHPYTTPLGGLVFVPNLYVTDSGERFMNEANHYAIMYDDMIKSGSSAFYSIFSGEALAEVLETGIEGGYVIKGESFEELAEAMGVPVETFVATVARFNDLAKKGTDEDFGNPAIAKIEEGILYALKVSPATLGSFGGPRVNLKGEVLNAEGKAIKGLYAVGEVANGQLFKSIYPASGSSITMGFTLGRVTGREAAQAAK